MARHTKETGSLLIMMHIKTSLYMVKKISPKSPKLSIGL